MSKKPAIFSKLKITDVTIYKFDIPRKDIFKIATMVVEKVENVLIRIDTSEGISGWGEASPFHSIVGETQGTDLAAAREIKPLLIGKNPLEIAARVEEWERYLPHHPTIKSAFDMALYDIAAKVAGLPLYAFLGGKYRDVETDFTLSIGSVREAAEKAQAILKMGFRILKIKVGIDDQSDYQRLQAVRNAVGDDIILRIDANQGWNRIQAIQNLFRFDEFRIEFCEQPCPATDTAGLSHISQVSPIPIMADESLSSPHSALELIQQDAVPYFNIKLSKSGGIFNALKIVHLAETAHRPCMMGGMSESRLGLTAFAHVALSSSIFKFFDLDTHFEHAEDPVLGGVQIEKGMVKVPQVPGIGAEPDPDYLKKLEVIK